MFPDANRESVYVCVCVEAGRVMDTMCWRDGGAAVRGPLTPAR